MLLKAAQGGHRDTLKSTFFPLAHAFMPGLLFLLGLLIT
jgi:hypothetical protein